jgi:hypothetical protein
LQRVACDHDREGGVLQCTIARQTLCVGSIKLRNASGRLIFKRRSQETSTST